MQALFKHAKNFVDDGKRPIFEGIYFDGENAVVTNTHLLIMVENQPSEKKNIHWKTGQPIDGIYPNIKRVIPSQTETNFIIPDISAWLPFLKTAMPISKKDSSVEYPVTLSVDKALVMQAKNAFENYTVSLPGCGDEFPKVAFNVKYLHDIFAFFKDVDVKKVYWGLNGPLAPMKLTTDKGVLAILTPIRTN